LPGFFDVDEAADFTLTVNGSGFTASSVVRWNGSDRPTTFVSSTRLTAAIAAADVSAIADIPVTVFDPAPPPGGTLTRRRCFTSSKPSFDLLAGGAEAMIYVDQSATPLKHHLE